MRIRLIQIYDCFGLPSLKFAFFTLKIVKKKAQLDTTLPTELYNLPPARIFQTMGDFSYKTSLFFCLYRESVLREFSNGSVQFRIYSTYTRYNKHHRVGPIYILCILENPILAGIVYNHWVYICIVTDTQNAINENKNNFKTNIIKEKIYINFTTTQMLMLR